MKVSCGKALQAFLRAIPMRRAGSVDEMSHLIIFLDSWRSSCIAGQGVNGNGG